MIADKRRSLDRALQFSYQGANIIKTDADLKENIRALINPNKLKPDYDDKILSVHHKHNFKPGDTFEWVGTNTHWLIYLQDLTELAYFRGDIRKCSHEISWEDEEGRHSAYAAIRGPVETKITTGQKHGIILDTPNYSLSIMLPKSESAINYFKRYSKFYLSDENDYKICWRVQAVDWLSMPGIIEITAIEYYRNETEDDVENGIVGGLKTESIDPNPDILFENITGETFIKPKLEYTYTYNGNVEGEWSVSDDCPVQLIPDGKTVSVKWLKTFSGQFDLYYANGFKKTIVVQSLF